MIGISKMYIDKVLDVKTFVDLASKASGEVLVKQGSEVIDGKSILGMFSVDTTRGVDVSYEAFDNEELNQFIAAHKEP